MKYNDDGEELPDDTPVELPLRFRNNPGELSRINQVVREVIRQYAEARDDETFEEASDLDTGEPEQDLFFSKYEVSEMQEETFRQVLTERGSRGKVKASQPDGDRDERPKGSDKSGDVDGAGKADGS